jgi:membrane fusion protein, multidrug efflux system
VPVRLAIEKPPSDVPLRTGLSASIEVDTGYTRGLPSPIRTALAWTGIGSAAASDISTSSIQHK